MRVLLADDHELFTEMAQFFLEHALPGTEVAVASSFTDALAMATSGGVPYDLVLLDLHMPGMHGLTGLTRMKQVLPATPVVIVSGSTNRQDMRAALRSGADGFIPKNLPARSLSGALKTVLAGGRFIPDVLLVDGGDGETVPEEPIAPAREPLTAREQDVIEALAAGCSNKEIAQRLGLAEETIKTHLKRIFAKLGARNRADAVRIVLAQR